MRPARKRVTHFTGDQYRALKFLTGSPRGHTETMVLAHGFSLVLLSDLIRAGLVIVKTERGGRKMPIGIARLRISKSGRKALRDRTVVDLRLGSMKQPRLDRERARALTLLAKNPDGCSEANMLARGFPHSLFNRLALAGLVTLNIEREESGDKPIKIAHLKITEAGRRALARPRAQAGRP
jgi:hypothetical protein